MEATQKPQPSNSNLNVALLPPPGFLGHLIPFIELAKKLVSNHNCHVTLILPHDGSSMKPQRELLREIPPSILPLFLPPVSTNDLPDDLSPEALLPIRVIRSLPLLRDALASLRTSGSPASALVVDLFAPYAIDVAREFAIPAYIFYVITTNDFSLAMDLPALDSSSASGFEDLVLPGNLLLPVRDLPDSMKDKSSQSYKWMLDLSKKYLSADGIIANSFLELESATFAELELRRAEGVPPVYAVGPLVRRSIESADWEGLKWLNEQPSESVLFVSFGSGGTLSLEQMGELALGLETSGHRFLWVVRRPREDVAAAYLDSIGDEDPLKFLPEGFLERTRGRGLVVASWAPQVEVLAHGSTGGFLTHCGWNSILESAVFGVPMMAWPLCFEHKMNAVFLTDGLKAAIRVKENENGVVERGHIAEVVKQLMGGGEGFEIRKRMMKLKSAADDALSLEGSSTKALAHVVKCWSNAN